MHTGLLRRALAEALAFLLPVECAGCSAVDVALCEGCLAQLCASPSQQVVDGLAVRSALVYDGVAARAILALKEEGRTALARPLGEALEAAAASWDLHGVIVVPVPTSAAAMRRRGYRVAELLARRAGWRPQRLVRTTRRTADQRTLGIGGRAANVAGSMRARGVAGARVLIVDDVVTTGATLRETARAVRAAGGEVIGAVTVAATPRRISRGRERTGPVR
ncbi:ComF family protein [Microbacterium lushaniae]|nr:ComF family protein [Microbacterium lushaniae]KAA9155697.1 ComF family protein [Microbacterium lushaniae]